jgi:hypothetical protein
VHKCDLVQADTPLAHTLLHTYTLQVPVDRYLLPGGLLASTLTMTAQRSATTAATAAAAAGSSSAGTAHIQPLRGLVVHVERANFTNDTAYMQWAAIARAAGATVVTSLVGDNDEQHDDSSSSNDDDANTTASAAQQQQHVVLCDNSLLVGTAAATAIAGSSAAAASAAASAAAGSSSSAKKSKGKEKAKAKRTAAAAVVQYQRAPTDWAVQCILQGEQVPIPTNEAPLLASVSRTDKQRYTVGDYVQYTDKHSELSYGQITSFNRDRTGAVLTPLQLVKPDSKMLQRSEARAVNVLLNKLKEHLLVLPASMYRKVAYKGWEFPLVYSLLDDSSSSSSCSASSCSGSVV